MNYIIVLEDVQAIEKRISIKKVEKNFLPFELLIGCKL